ncbi:MAG: hypothetical protein HY366_00975 [Candidatus Aenigmarchaeota archaeon]|nr:hypothetical protein [Candidatus Aenigmarchaeota archaeon]
MSEEYYVSSKLEEILFSVVRPRPYLVNGGIMEILIRPICKYKPPREWRKEGDTQEDYDEWSHRKDDDD